MESEDKNENQEKTGCCGRKKDGWQTGIFFVTLGVIFLLNNYGIANIDIGKLWPLFLIIPGILMILGKSK